METLETQNLDNKINENFQGLVVRKDLVSMVKGNAIVPSYVLEFLLGQYCATNDEASIEAGIESVKKILSEHYVNRNEAGLIKSKIKEKGRHKVIDKISVSLNEKDDCYEASFANLGINKVLIDSRTVKAHLSFWFLGFGVLLTYSMSITKTRNQSLGFWRVSSRFKCLILTMSNI